MGSADRDGSAKKLWNDPPKEKSNHVDVAISNKFIFLSHLNVFVNETFFSISQVDFHPYSNLNDKFICYVKRSHFASSHGKKIHHDT